MFIVFFLDKDGIVKYVGRTVDLYRRFLQIWVYVPGSFRTVD